MSIDFTVVMTRHPFGTRDKKSMIGMQDQALPLYFRGILDGDEREHTGGKHHPEVISSRDRTEPRELHCPLTCEMDGRVSYSIISDIGT